MPFWIFQSTGFRLAASNFSKTSSLAGAGTGTSTCCTHRNISISSQGSLRNLLAGLLVQVPYFSFTLPEKNCHILNFRYCLHCSESLWACYLDENMNTWVIEVKLEDSLNFLIPSFITARSNVTYLLLSKCMKSTCLSHPFKIQFWFTKNQFAPLNLWVQKTFDAKCSQVSSIFLNPKLIAIILTFWNHYFKS